MEITEWLENVLESGWQNHPGTHCGHYFSAGETRSLCKRENRSDGKVSADSIVKCSVCKERVSEPSNLSLFDKFK